MVELVPKGMRSHYLTLLNLNYILHINYILLQQEPFVTRDAVSKEQNHMASSSVDITELPTQQSISLNNGSASRVLQNLTEHITERASSPFSSDGSDDVFASTVAKDKVVPAMHRGDLNKPRRPFKSDSSVSSITESPVTREALLSDSNVSSCTDKSALASSQSTQLTMSVVNYQMYS